MMSGYVGMPEGLYLQQFGSLVEDVFGEVPFHVGSSVSRTDGQEKGKWRDVDVRVIIDDKDWKRWGFGNPDTSHIQDAKWIALCMAFSELGRKMTGLPIDFQIQPRTYANKKWPMDKHPRSALGMVPWRFKK